MKIVICLQIPKIFWTDGRTCMGLTMLGRQKYRETYVGESLVPDYIPFDV